MAFNPFRRFRKHQKIIIAGITILCMVTFVMCGSMGKGDFFETIAHTFTGRSRGEVVATMYGKDITAKEVQELRSQRRLANQYMLSFTAAARNNAIRDAYEASRKWDDSAQQFLSPKQIVQELYRLRENSSRSRQDQFQYLNTLQGVQRFLPQMEFSLIQANKAAEANVFQHFAKALQQEWSLYQRPKTQLYFGGTTSLDDILDFMIWRHEADRRGIQLTRQDISELVIREGDNQEISRSEQKKIEQALTQSFRTFNAESFRAALADEFRVRIAKSALMGDDQANPYLTWATPYEFWQFYKENRTENVLAVLPIPARNKDFFSQVGQPPEKELKDLFEKYKDKEHQADSPDPGFKIPPRIEAEWVSANPNSEHYRKEAARRAALSKAGFQVMAGGGQTMSGCMAVDALNAAYPFAWDSALKIVWDSPSKTGRASSVLDLYELDRYNLRNASWNEEWSKFFNPRLHETSIRRVDNTLAALGQLLGGNAMQAPVISSVCVFAESARAHESHDRAVIGLTTALASTNPNPFLSAAMAYYGSPKPQFIPLAEVNDQYAAKLQEEMAKMLVENDLGELQNKLRDESRETAETLPMSQAVNRPELIAATLGQALGSAATGAPMALTTPTTLGPPAIYNYQRTRAREALVSALAGPNPTPFLVSGLAPVGKIRKAIDGAVKRYGLEHGSTRQPEDRESITNDPGLAPFKDAYLHDTQNRDPQVKNFANQLFQNRSAYSPQPWPLGRSEFDQGPSFLYWKTNDKAAYVPSFAEVQEKVKDWWQLEKARDLAKKEAEDVKAKAQGQPDAQRWLKDGSKHSQPMFLLDEVAGLVKPRTPFAGQSSDSYKRYVVPSEKIEYPPEGLENDLVKMNEAGQVIVKSDLPKATYYVFALVKRSQPSQHAFYSEYKSGPESLLGAMEQETGYQAEYRKGIITQLREEAHLRIIEENRKQVDEGQRGEE